MKNLRYATEDRSVIQAEDAEGNILNIPADPRNRHYAEIAARAAKGEVEIAEPTIDPTVEESARKQRVAARMLEALADDASAGKDLDQIRAEAKAVVATEVLAKAVERGAPLIEE